MVLGREKIGIGHQSNELQGNGTKPSRAMKKGNIRAKTLGVNKQSRKSPCKAEQDPWSGENKHSSVGEQAIGEAFVGAYDDSTVQWTDANGDPNILGKGRHSINIVQ